MQQDSPQNPSWPWQLGGGMFLALVVTGVAVAFATQAESFHVRWVSLGAAGWGFAAYVWLCCVLARGRGYHPAVGLLGLTIVGGFALPFLPSESHGPLARRSPFQWIGAKHLFSVFAAYVLIAGAFWNSFESQWVLDNLYIIKYDPRTRATTWLDPGSDVATRAPGVINYFTQDYWWPKGISGLYRPLTSITYWVNWTVLGNGEDTTGFHVVNLIVHWLNAALLYALAYVLTRKWGLATLASLIFAVHPITTESVTNIIGRADLFAALAVLSGVLVWHWGVELPRWRILWGFGAAMLITAFGVFSKESAVAIGLILLTYDVTYRWHPAIVKWFGVVLLASLVPAIAGASFAIHPPITGLAKPVMIAIAAGIVLVALLIHAFNRDQTPGVRLTVLGVCLVLSVIACAFWPAAGIVLVAVLVVYEYCVGPWLQQTFPRFHEVRVQALLYTGVFVIVVFLPFAVGAAFWFRAGAAAKHGLVGVLNVLGDSWPSDILPRWTLGWDQRIPLAALFVLVGLFGWLYFTLRDARLRKLGLVTLATLPFAAAAILGTDVRLLLIVGSTSATGAIAVALFGRRDDRAHAWLGLPVVVTAAIGASFFVFYAGLCLTFVVGLTELIRRTAMPTPLRDNPDWRRFVQRFAVGYFLLLPPVIMMFFVRYYIFNIVSTPPETPFLDNPLRGGPFDPLPFWQSRLTAIKVMGKLIYLLIWPVHLTSDYSWDQIRFFLDPRAGVWENCKTIVALLTVIGLIWLAVRNHARNKPLFFFIMFFFAAILPTSNIPTLIGSIMAERFLYLPLIGFAGAIALAAKWLYDKLIQRTDEWNLPGLLTRSAVGVVAPAIVLGLFSWRSYLRNFDWKNDITLWEAARVVSPRSFRCYQSLAFALYEQDSAGNIDRMISIAEQARPIVDPLPHDRNSSRLYLHLGMYYNIKGELLCKRDNNGNLIVTPEARPWFDKAVEVLERGVAVDRTFNAVNRRKQVERGDLPEAILDAGLTPVYMTLGISYLRKGMYRESFNAFNYQRQLEPESTDPYVRIALLYIEQGKLEEAAIALVQTLLLDWRREDAWSLLAQIYGTAGPVAQGAILQSPQGPRLNVDHPLVRDHFISAYRDFIRIFRRANRAGAAESARQAAVYRYKMPPSLFDSLMIEDVPRVTPHGLIYGASAGAE